VVLCGAGMDARAYRLSCLRNCRVFELDVKPVLDYKIKKIATVGGTDGGCIIIIIIIIIIMCWLGGSWWRCHGRPLAACRMEVLSGCITLEHLAFPADRA
jgi:hypothetical protein